MRRAGLTAVSHTSPGEASFGVGSRGATMYYLSGPVPGDLLNFSRHMKGLIFSSFFFSEEETDSEI